MAGLLGMRVMRGPDWEHGETDGGEGHLGTLTKKLSDDTVYVVWDMGTETTCKAGLDGKFDLRLFDTAQAGVRHPNSRCAECGDCNIYGMLWRCQVCADCELCSVCYNEDKHDIRHQFLRIDHFESEGLLVKRRDGSVQMRTVGIFPGSVVTRGRDWLWGDQDGGAGSEGEVLGFENVAPDSSRNLVQVKWPNGQQNSYRLGFAGCMDLSCVEEEDGPSYYRDHLPLLDAKNLPYPLAPVEAFTTPPAKPSTTSAATSNPASSESLSATSGDTDPGEIDGSSTPPRPPKPDWLTTGSEQKSESSDSLSDGAVGGSIGTAAKDTSAGTDEHEDLACFTVGDKVMVGVSENELRDLQEDFGEVSTGMVKRLGDMGTVTDVSTGVLVQYSSISYRFNPLALVKVTSFKEGDIVRLRRKEKQVKLLNKHIAWNQDIADACGTVGRVIGIDSDDTVTVNFGHYQTFRLAAACCVPSPGASVDTVGATAGARRAKLGALSAQAVSSDSGIAEGARPVIPPRNTRGMAQGKGTYNSGAAPLHKNNNYEDEGSAQSSYSDSGVSDKMMSMLGMKDSDGSSDHRLKVLFHAISSGDANAVRTMVRANRFLLTRTEQGLTPLMYASYKGKFEMVRTLIDLGADINGLGKRGRTPLIIALEAKEEDVALKLLDLGANLHVKSDKKRNALHAAAYQNLSAATQALIFMGADVNAKDVSQDTPLFDAVEKGSDQAVEVLLQAETLNPNELNAKGFNMLHLACYEGKSSRIVELMLSSPRHPDVNDLLLGEYAPLHICAVNDRHESIGLLVLLGGAKIDIADGRRKLTPLHLACKTRKFQSAECLIGLGATVNAVDINGNTPLHLAMGKRLEGENDDADASWERVTEERSKLARLLISHGATVEVEDNEGRTPLYYGRPEVQDNIKQFLETGGVQECAGPVAARHSPDRDRSSPHREEFSAIPASLNLGKSDRNFAKIMHTEDEGKTHSNGEAAAGRSQAPAAPQQRQSSLLKQFDVNYLHFLLQGAATLCRLCDKVSDITLQPCGHRSVCKDCCDRVKCCPICDKEIQDREPDNTDDQEDETEEVKDD